MQGLPQRVLHIVENLNRGAVENWLLRMLRLARRRGVETDWSFYCVLGQPGSHDAEARSLRSNVIYSPVPLGDKSSFIRALRWELRRREYGVLHCHHDLVNAVYLLAALGLPIYRRIVHVHNADDGLPTQSQLKQFLWREPMRRFCLSRADRIVGISDHTLDTFLAGRVRKPGRDSVHYYGVDPSPFENNPVDRAKFRRECRIPEDALILLFGGRLVPEKNPLFVVNMLSHLRRLEPRAVGIFAGSGSEERGLINRARQLGVENSVRLLGWRSDLPEIMSASDWFILPHPEYPMEGFGLAVVEAQLAGLRLLLSYGVPDDPLLPTACFRRLRLSSGAEAWAVAAIELLQNPAPSQAAALSALRESPMNMDRALDDLLALYV